MEFPFDYILGVSITHLHSFLSFFFVDNGNRNIWTGYLKKSNTHMILRVCRVEE